MNPGPVEEVGETARSAISALAGNPACLAATILAVLFSILLFVGVSRERANAHQAEMALLERCFPIALMNSYRDLMTGGQP